MLHAAAREAAAASAAAAATAAATATAKRATRAWRLRPVAWRCGSPVKPERAALRHQRRLLVIAVVA